MADTKQKLELRWHGKDEWESPEPRLLIEEEVYEGEKKGIDDNLLIYGDNLLGLKALERDYTGKVKCIYIDPPYNTKSCFKHYNDNLEHSLWLNMMKERLVIMHKLLREDGSIWISIDDRECHYLKVMCDEIFGRKNFIGSLIWKKRKGGGNDSSFFSTDHEYVLSYANNSDKKNHLKKWRIPHESKQLKRYKEINHDGRFFYWDTLNRQGLKNPIPIDLVTPDGKIIKILSQRSKDTVLEEVKSGDIRFVERNNRWTVHRKVFMNDDGQVLRSILSVGTNSDARNEIKKLIDSEKKFEYPKPESLIHQILQLVTKPGDLVLDSFAGSGTTGAVAHKMKRRWIMIEFNGPCHSHIIPRMEKVIDGEDPGGVTEQVGWKGGGGFRYCEMAPSLLEKNRLGRWTISKKYNPAMLSEAVCLHAGYKPAPKRDPYWMHGYSTESDFIYVTSQTLTRSYLEKLSEEVGEDRSLMVFCGAFKADGKEFENLTVRKIPKAILNKCTWGKDDYSLKIALTKEVEVANRKKRVQRVPVSTGRRSRAPMAAQGGR